MGCHETIPLSSVPKVGVFGGWVLIQTFEMNKVWLPLISCSFEKNHIHMKMMGKEKKVNSSFICSNFNVIIKKNCYSGHVMGNQDIDEFLVVVRSLDLY